MAACDEARTVSGLRPMSHPSVACAVMLTIIVCVGACESYGGSPPPQEPASSEQDETTWAPRAESNPPAAKQPEPDNLSRAYANEDKAYVAASDSAIEYGRSLTDQWQRADEVLGQTAEDISGKLPMVKMSLAETNRLSDASRGLELVRADSRRAVQNCVSDLRLRLQVSQSKLWEASCREADAKVGTFSKNVQLFLNFWSDIRARNGL